MITQPSLGLEDTRPPIYHIGISGGKDSAALLLWAVNESGYPLESIRATFADTGNEHEFTYEHIELLSKRFFRLKRLSQTKDFTN